MMRLAPAVGAALILMSGTLSAATTVPRQKVGLWQETISRDGTPAPMGATQVCLDQAAEEKLSVFSQKAAGGAKCGHPTIAHNADGSWSSDSACDIGGGIKSSAHAVVTGDFNSKILTTIDATVVGAPAAAMNGKHRMVVTATWLGACKPGQKGGDMIMSNGMKLNLLDMAKTMRTMTGKPPSAQ